MSEKKEEIYCEEMRRSDLEFFGRIAASFSHEVNNVISGIYEIAGLLEDLSMMAERGRPLDPGRVRKNAGSITRQAERGVSMIKHFNKFAHSVDDPGKVFELSAYLENIVSVSERLASIKNVNLSLGPVPSLNVKLCPFTFQKAVFMCFDAAFETLEHDGTINVSSEHRDSSVFITIEASPISDINTFNNSVKLMPSVCAEMNAVCEVLAEPGDNVVKVLIEFRL